MSGGAVARLYDRLSDFESRRSEAAYPIHKRLSFDEPGLEDVYDWIVRTTPIEPGAVVLDAGCGVGYGTARLAGAAEGVRALGISLSEAEVRLARQYTSGAGDGALRFEVASYDSTFTERFDLIVAVESLKHSPAVAASLRHLGESLRPGGQLVVVDDFYDGAEDDPMARVLAATWRLEGLHRVDRYTTALDAAVCTRDDLTGGVRLRSALANRMRFLGLSIASALPGSAGRIARIFRGGVALDRLYARGTMRYLAIRYRRPVEASR